jgi:membrane-bound ClpP family serine protease
MATMPFSAGSLGLVLLLAQAVGGSGGSSAPSPPLGSNYFFWAVACLTTALVLFIIELFVPSGGLIGVGAALGLIMGIVLMFRFNTTVGLICAIGSLIALPILFAIGLKVWPKTSLAKRLTLKNSTRQMDAPSAGATHPRVEPSHLVGMNGTALTDLRPVGTCLIEGRRIECLAESGVIRAGAKVSVIAADGLQTKVRPADEQRLFQG